MRASVCRGLSLICAVPEDGRDEIGIENRGDFGLGCNHGFCKKFNEMLWNWVLLGTFGGENVADSLKKGKVNSCIPFKASADTMQILG